MSKTDCIVLSENQKIFRQIGNYIKRQAFLDSKYTKINYRRDCDVNYNSTLIIVIFNANYK